MSKKNPYQAHLINFKKILFDIFKWSGWPFLFIFRIKKVYETPKAKKMLKGGALVISNHLLYSDPMVLHCVYWYRRLYFVVMKELASTKFKAWFYKNCGCIPVDRERFSLSSFRTIVQILEGGNVIGIFPAGHVTLKNDNPMLAFKSGAVMMAYQANVPIVPTYRELRKSAWHRQRVVIGEPINLKEKFGENLSMKEIEQITEYLYQKEIELKKIYHEEK